MNALRIQARTFRGGWRMSHRLHRHIWQGFALLLAVAVGVFALSLTSNTRVYAADLAPSLASPVQAHDDCNANGVANSANKGNGNGATAVQCNDEGKSNSSNNSNNGNNGNGNNN